MTKSLAVCLGHDSESKFHFVCEVAIEVASPAVGTESSFGH